MIGLDLCFQRRNSLSINRTFLSIYNRSGSRELSSELGCLPAFLELVILFLLLDGYDRPCGS